VTIFGQSAGGGSVAALLAMPRAAGLFHRAVASSVPGVFFTPELAADIGSACAAELGLRATVEDLSTVDPAMLPFVGDEVMAKIGQFADRWGQAAHKSIPFAAVVDGDVLPVVPWEGLTGDVDLIVGHTRHEQRLLTMLEGRLGQVTPAQAAAEQEALAPGLAYPEMSPDELYEVIGSDWVFRMPSLHLAEAQVAAGGRAYLYEVTWEPPGRFGACHGLDVPLLFGNLTQGQTAAVLGEVTADTEAMSAALRAMLVGFAADGDPGWPAYDPEVRLTRLFDVPVTVATYPEEVSRQLWASHRFAALPLLE
jgi:para-nitrobenzyl esterase